MAALDMLQELGACYADLVGSDHVSAESSWRELFNTRKSITDRWPAASATALQEADLHSTQHAPSCLLPHRTGAQT